MEEGCKVTGIIREIARSTQAGQAKNGGLNSQNVKVLPKESTGKNGGNRSYPQSRALA